MDPVNLFLSLVFITVSCLIIWRSSHGFEIASDFLGRNLPPGIKGATINAIASSMPEFLTTIFFLFYLRDADGFSGGLGVSSGSALFNLLIIPALAVLTLTTMGKGKKVVLNKKVLLREGLVLLLSQVLFVSFLFSSSLTETHGLWLVMVYICYLLLLFIITRRRSNEENVSENTVKIKSGAVPKKLLYLDVAGLILDGRRISPGRAWLILIISTLIMTMGTWLLVLGTDMFGEETRIPLIFVAVVLSAAATSVPDTIISMKDARKGNYDDAVSNALGSNIFDIAFALGLPVLLYNLFYNEDITLPGEIQDFTQEVWVFLLLATLIALIIMLAGKYFTRMKAWLLLAVYLIFLFFVGTQVNQTLGGIGAGVKSFLTTLADFIGRILDFLS